MTIKRASRVSAAHVVLAHVIHCIGAPASHAQRSDPAEFTIGNAVTAINYYMSAWIVNDLFKMAGFETEDASLRPGVLWVPVIDGKWTFDRMGDVKTDTQGWPASLALDGGGSADTLWTIILDSERAADFPSGTYRVLWEGSGTVDVEGPTAVERVGTRELRFEHDGSAGIVITVSATDPLGAGDHIRDIRVLRPDAVEGQPFNARYLEDISPFTVIRPLALLGEEGAYGSAFAWEERKSLDRAHWGGSFGAPYEVAIDLANASDSDLWLTVPIAASDGFMRELATLVHDRLDEDLGLYVELGNELWNFAPPFIFGREHAAQQARARWPGVEGTITDYSDGDPVNEAMMAFSWQGARTAEMGAIFRGVFNDDERIDVVLAGQVGASVPGYYPSRYLLSSPVWVGEDGARPAAAHADAFAIAPYVSEPADEGPFSFSRDSAKAYIADAIAYVRGEAPWDENSVEPGLRHMIRSDKALAETYDLPLIAYEGGQHFTGSVFTRDTVNTHPDMAVLYHALFDVWQEEGGGLFVHSAGITPRGINEPAQPPNYFQSENFGIKERQTDTGDDAPKWRAVRSRMRELGQIPQAHNDK